MRASILKKASSFLLASALVSGALCVPNIKTDAAAQSGLSNASAIPQAASLYSYLNDVYGTHILAGQQESTWMGSSEYEMNIIEQASGKLPVIRGLDYMNDDFAGVNQRAKTWYARGGIVTICWHCGSDFSGSHSDALADSLDWNQALTPGTAAYDKLIAGMDKGAKALKELQDAGIPVLWRPFHEFDGAWFWWGKGGAENFKQLWRIMYERYTNDWGLNNLIWVLGYSGETKDGWYPGDAYVDIVGSDTYVDHTGSLIDMYRKTAAVSDKPVCLHENGSIPNPANLTQDGAKWLWFMTWHTDFVSSHAINTADYLRQVYTSDYVITLDELPDNLYTNYQAAEDGQGGEAEFEMQSFELDLQNRSGAQTVELEFEGTPNAATNGCIGYAVGEEWYAIEWEATLDDTGYSTILIDISDIPDTVGSAVIQIWWAGTWDSAAEQSILAENTLLRYQLIGGTLLGDVNENGSVEIADAVLLQKYLLAVSALTESQAAAADLDQNHRLNATDLTMLKRKLLPV